MNFEIFDKVVHSFGKSDEVIIQQKNAYFQQIHEWFDAQLSQKILNGLYSQSQQYSRWCNNPIDFEKKVGLKGKEREL